MLSRKAARTSRSANRTRFTREEEPVTPQIPMQTPLAPSSYIEGKLMLSVQTAAQLYTADQAIRSLDAFVASSGNAQSLARALARVETLASFKRTSGKQRGIEKLIEEEHGNARILQKDPDARQIETLRSKNALLRALELADDAPLGIDELRAVHAELFRGTTRESFGGVLRASRTPAGSSRYHAFGSSYVPPAPEQIEPLLRDIASFCANPAYPPLIQAALAHAHLVEASPFSRGNGNLARIAIHAVFRSRGLAKHAIVPLSTALATSSHNYYDCLERYCAEFRESAADQVICAQSDGLGSGAGKGREPNAQARGPEADAHAKGADSRDRAADEGDRRADGEHGHRVGGERDGRKSAADAYLQYFSRSCLQSAQSAQAFAEKCEQLVNGWQEQLGCRSDAASLLVVKALPGMPMFTVEEMAQAVDRSFKRTSVSIAELEGAGIVSNATRGKRNRIFVARDIVDLYANMEGLR